MLLYDARLSISCPARALSISLSPFSEHAIRCITRVKRSWRDLLRAHQMSLLLYASGQGCIATV